MHTQFKRIQYNANKIIGGLLLCTSGLIMKLGLILQIFEISFSIWIAFAGLIIMILKLFPARVSICLPNCKVGTCDVWESTVAKFDMPMQFVRPALDKVLDKAPWIWSFPFTHEEEYYVMGTQ